MGSEVTVCPREGARVGAGATSRDLVEWVLAEHVDDGSGCCAACPHRGPVEWRRWPCRLHSLAALARETTLAAAPDEHSSASTPDDASAVPLP